MFYTLRTSPSKRQVYIPDEVYDRPGKIFLVLLSLQTEIVSCNSVDPDEMAFNEPFHQNLHCLSFFFMYLFIYFILFYFIFYFFIFYFFIFFFFLTYMFANSKMEVSKL